MPAQAEPASPLATADQRELDARAMRLKSQVTSAATMQAARIAYGLSRLAPASREAAGLLDRALDELSFSALLKAINGDPLYPKVHWMNAPPRDWFCTHVAGSRYAFDNPDNVYRTIPIEGGSRYIVKGRRSGRGPVEMTFSLISNVNAQWSIDVLTSDELVLEPDGSYTITVDSAPAAGRINHIRATPAARQLFIRSNLGDWLTETPDALTVTRLGPPPARPPMSDAAILKLARENFLQSLFYYGVGANAWKTFSNPVNILPAPVQSATVGTLVTQASSFGHFRIRDDEALMVHVKLGGAKYFVLPVTDPWTITTDPIGHQSSLNQAQARPDADGSFTFVVAARDPGVHNWLDTVGLHEGTIMARWQALPEQTPPEGGPAITARVVKLSELARVLPPETARVTPAERQAMLEARRAGYLRRIATDAACPSQ